MHCGYLQYRDLKEWLSEFSEANLDKTVTIYDANIDEFIPVTSAVWSNSDVIDAEEDDYPILEIGDASDSKQHSCTDNLVIVDVIGQWVSFCSLCKETFVSNEDGKFWTSIKESEPKRESTTLDVVNFLTTINCDNPFIVVDGLFEGHLTPHWEDNFFSFSDSSSFKDRVNEVIDFCHKYKWKILYFGSGTDEAKNRWWNTYHRVGE